MNKVHLTKCPGDTEMETEIETEVELETETEVEESNCSSA